MQVLIRRLLISLLLAIASVVLVVMIGAKGLGKRIGAPGLDTLISGLRDRFENVAQTGEFPQTTLPGNMHEIAGTWSGISDVDGRKWQFSFEQNYAVRVKSSSGYFIQGTAYVHWDLGLTDGVIRVPPGWSVLDVDIIQSSEPSHRNRISPGAFSLQGDILKYCFAEPGSTARPITDRSREGIQCFELRREKAGAVQQPTVPVPGRAPAAPAPHPSAVSSGDGELPGTSLHGVAELIIDGARETFLLRIDPEAATDLSDPRHASLQYQAYGARYPAAQRIELVLNATRKGRHLADGLAYLDNLFIKEKVPVGSEIGGVPSAVFLYIAEGGRVFPPRSSCNVQISVPDKGLDDVVIEGSLSDCEVESAGEIRSISSVVFSVRGKGR